MAHVEIYTTQACPYCVMAKRLMKEKGVAYQEIDVQSDFEKRKWLVETTGQRTVPQVFIDGKPYGGFTDIAALDKKGELNPLLGL
ncbi:MAG TPA: glutaredoxin 3 [Polyangiales bacterium]|nr:glutaredoxin 3 [Polyangiales bacterium]